MDVPICGRIGTSIHAYFMVVTTVALADYSHCHYFSCHIHTIQSMIQKTKRLYRWTGCIYAAQKSAKIFENEATRSTDDREIFAAL
jgi:hypothetical protein